ncbi:MAG: hypothetical protein DRI90_09290, partial [Deltaproteobacteria bacterium]
MPQSGPAKAKSIGRYDLGRTLTASYFGPLREATVNTGDDAGSTVSLREVDCKALTAEEREHLAAAAKRASALDHDGVVPILDVVAEDDQLALVSAGVTGEPMRSVLRLLSVRRKVVPVPVLLRITLDLLEAVGYVHDQLGAMEGEPTLGYGGLTPDSVFVSADGTSRMVEPALGGVLRGVKKWATHPKRLGYDAPEALTQHGIVTANGDLYSIAALAWELLVGKRLWPGASHSVIATKQKSGPAARADSKKRAGADPVPKGLADVLARAVANEPADRFDSAGAMTQAIEALDLSIATRGDVTEFVQSLAKRSGSLFPKAAKPVAPRTRGLGGRAPSQKATEIGMARSPLYQPPIQDDPTKVMDDLDEPGGT